VKHIPGKRAMVRKRATVQTCAGRYGSIQVSVGMLVKLLFRNGDIHFRYDSSTLPEEGRLAQKRVQASLLKNPAYSKEVSVQYSWHSVDISVHLQGRADGLMLDAYEILVEEYKTTRSEVEALHVNTGEMFMAQLRLYAGMLAQQHPDQARWKLALVYLDPDTLLENRKSEIFDTHRLSLFLEQACQNFASYIVSHRRFLLVRNDSLQGLGFPYPEFRNNQKLLSANVFRNLRDSKHTLFEAPTGSGKTLATLFPALKAMGHNHLDRMVFLTARNTGKQAVEGAMQLLASTGANVRSISLTAKHRICFQESVNCDPQVCKYAKGYYSRVDEAVDACLNHAQIQQSIIEKIALEYEVCPFELSLDVSVWCDVVVCDYNYVFDPFVRFMRLAGIFGEKTALLIDESHHLVDRVRGCLSASFSITQIKAAIKVLELSPGSDKYLSGMVNALNKQMSILRRKGLQSKAGNWKGELAIKVPVKLLSTSSLLVDYLSKDSVHSSSLAPELLELFFACLELTRKFELFDNAKYHFFLEWDGRSTTLHLFCANPVVHIARSIKAFPASLRFSGTLSPIGLYETLHGVENSELWRVDAPFASEQLGVFVLGDIPTQYRHRGTSRHKVVEIISITLSAKDGSYLIAFPSYEYLRQIYELFVVEHPQVCAQAQTPGMSTAEQEDFLRVFKNQSSDIVGFVVLGGIFTESIDFAGNQLMGMIVVGIGLPPPNLRTLAIAGAYAASRSGGFGRLVAFRHPAMSRVIQAAGRLIRSHEDRGVLCLIDPRYRQADYKCFFPDNWCSCYVNSLELPVELERFWMGSNNNSERITG